ncbi:MAG: phosphoribosylglycinamide formyltransferase [Deltaproteobacteria bacterium]|nr:phosphoribosylglycinamide formyltransferase [Deltaproteobacteria bacterium]
MLKLGFLASRHGSNMQAVIDACAEGGLNAKPVVIISNNSKSGAGDRARKEKIPFYHLSGRTHPDAETLDTAILDALLKYETDLVILAGYMKKIGLKTLDRFQGKILNIHPALLPKFGGEGMYGTSVHEAVLASGDKETGVTIHLADGEYDTGPIVAQTRVPVLEGDTVESLASRVLDREHTFLVETLKKFES